MNKTDSSSPQAVSTLKLQEAAHAVHHRIPQLVAEGSLIFTFTKFHGFLKAGIPKDILDPLVRTLSLRPGQVQVEVAGVLEDLAREVHIHERTRAHVTCVGENFGLPNPRDAYAFLAGRWTPMRLGENLDIPAGIEHGFTVDPGGCLYFLSVQSPPLISEDGTEDYIARPYSGAKGRVNHVG
jgi:hypothetical protein